MKTIKQLSDEAKAGMSFPRGWRSRLFIYNQPDTSGSSAQAQVIYWILLGAVALAWAFILA